MIDISKLNDMQQKAVLSESKQLLILAGAGTGKTTTVTAKIANLIQNKNVNPKNILAITFTNKAAQEMRDRIINEIGYVPEGMWMFTFHGMCLRILKQFINRLGYKNDFVIYDTEDKLSLLQSIIKELQLNTDYFPKKKVASVISVAKLEGQGPEELFTESDFFIGTVSKIYMRYQSALKEANALDFDDLIKMTVELFDTNEDVRDYYSDRFEYIFVDEYQDTNMQQFKLIAQLAKNHKNLCVVGDDDQSIYKFRGADIKNILGFEKVYPKAEIIKLEENYRSTKKILTAANLLIANNKNRKSKQLWTSNDDGEDVLVYEFRNDYQEAEMVADKIMLFGVQNKFRYKDVAILYRTNAQSRAFEEFFVRLNIPYKIVGGINFYQRKEIKDILAYLKVVANSIDETSLRRIINVPKRGIGDATLDKVNEYAMLNNVTFYDALLNVDNIDTLNSGTKKKIREFTNLIEEFKEISRDYNVTSLVKSIVENTGYLLSFTLSEERQEREDNINELIAKAEYFDERDEENNLIEFLQEVSLFTDLDEVEDDTDYVKLMTVHNAKGLEFPCVFLVGMENDTFPSYLSSMEEGGLEEERRLCYVAITRAKKLLNITWARKRYNKDKLKSRFIEEIQAITYQKESSTPITSNNKSSYNMIDKYNKKAVFNRTTPIQTNNYIDTSFEIGQRVSHKKFGEGTITNKYEKSGHINVTVDFDRSGEKELTLTFARLTKI